MPSSCCPPATASGSWGWGQNGGACGDIWAFDGKAWTRQGQPCDVCLFGATATGDGVWRVGGFPGPGGKARLTAARYDEDGSVAEINAVIAPGKQYCASALFVLDPTGRQPSGVGTLYAASAYRHVLFSIGSERGATIQVSDVEGSSAQGVLMPRNYYHIQPAVFQGAAFFQMLLPDRDARGSRLVSYLVKVDRSR